MNLQPNTHNAHNTQEHNQSPQDDLETLEKEIQDALNSFENDFASFASEQVTQNTELEELFFEDREKFFKKIIEMQNEFLSGLKSKMAKADELKSTKDANNKKADFEAKLKEFAQAHPDVDVNELIEFASALPQDVQDQLNELPSKFFYEALYELYKRKDEIQGEQGEKEETPTKETLPQQIQGVSLNQELASEANLPMTRQ